MPDTYMVYSIVPMKPRKGYPKREANLYSEIFWFSAAIAAIGIARAWLILLVVIFA